MGGSVELAGRRDSQNNASSKTGRLTCTRRTRACSSHDLDQLDTQQAGDGNPPALDPDALSRRARTTPVTSGVHRDGSVIVL